MHDGMTVATSHVGDVAILHVAGDVDIASAPNLRATIGRMLTASPSAVVLDLSQVEFLASVGLTILLETRHKLGDAFAVVASSPATSRPIRLTHIDDVVALYATVQEAVTALTAR